MAVSFNLDGQALTFPDWASEATAEQMLDILKGIAKSSGASEKDQKKVTDSAKKTLDELKKGNANDDVTAEDQKKRDEKLLKENKKLGDGFKELGNQLEQYKVDKAFDASFLGTLKASFESEGENVGRAIMTTGEHLYKGAAYVGGAVQQYGAMLGNSILGAGESLNDLAKVGVGFNDTYSGMAETAGLGVAQLAGLTGSFGGAAALISASAKVVATQGFGNFTKSMRFASDISEELGMSLEDSMGVFSESLKSRQMLMNVGNADQGRMNKQIQKSTKMQMAYATAIGVSTEEMSAFVESLTRNNGLLTSSLLRFDDTLRGDVIAGIEVFASGLAGMGGQAGQDIASAFLEAGTAGAIGMSQAATGFVTALPSLAGPMNEFANAMKDGTLTQEQSKDMVNSLTGQLGNLSAGEKDRIYQMARIGDESAKTMANAIAQFEQSEDKLKEVNEKFGTAFNMDAVQKGTNQFNKMMTNISGGASNAFYSLFADPEIMKVIEDGMAEIFAMFGMGVDDLAGSAMDAGGMVKSMVPAVKSFVGFIVDIGKSVAGFFAKFKTDEGFDFGAMFSGIIGKAKSALFTAILTFVGIWLGATVATHYAKTVLGPAIGKFGKELFAKHKGPAMAMAKNALEYTKGMFAKHGPAAMNMAKNALNYSKGLFAGGATTGKNILNNSIAYAKDVFNTSGAKGVASKMSGYASAFGKKIFSGGDKIAKTVASAASSFMGKLTKGGAPDVVGKGVAKAGGLVSSLGAKAKALVPKGLSDKVSGMGGKVSGMLKGASDNADKATMPMGKGGGFLQTIADAVKKFGDSKVLKGAAAIALLGASVGIAGVGLKQFNDVDFASIVKGTLALGGLAALAQVLGKGSMGMIQGAAAIVLLGAAVIPLAFGLSLMKDVGFKTIGVLAAGLLTLGGAAAILSFASPFIIAGSFAIAALGVALGVFGVGMSLVTGPLNEFITGMSNLAEVNGKGLASAAGGVLAVGAAMALLAPMLPFMLIGALAGPAIEKIALATMMFNFTDMKNLALAGPALKSLGEGMSSLSGGSLMSSIKDGIGSLFGADSPIEKIKNFIEGFKGIDYSGLFFASEGLLLLQSSILGLPKALDLAMSYMNVLGEHFLTLADSSRSIGIFGSRIGPFAQHMETLAISFMLLGDRPFSAFDGVEEQAKGMDMFATSTERLSSALGSIEFDYIADGFQEIAYSIEDMAAAMSDISMGDMLKMGAMRLLGPSKEEIQEDDKQTAVKHVAGEKLRGTFGSDEGLQGLMDNISMSSGKNTYAPGESAKEQMLLRLPEIGAAGIDLDVKKMQSKELGVAATEMQRVTGLLQSQIDMYRMQESSGVIVAKDVPTTAQPVKEELVATPGKISPNSPTADKKKLEEAIGGDMTQSELLTELVRLTQLNNNLLKKGNKITAEIEV